MQYLSREIVMRYVSVVLMYYTRYYPCPHYETVLELKPVVPHSKQVLEVERHFLGGTEGGGTACLVPVPVPAT